MSLNLWSTDSFADVYFSLVARILAEVIVDSPAQGTKVKFKNARSFFLVNIGILSRYRVKRPRKAWEGVPRPPCQFYNKQLTKKSALAYADVESKARTSAVLLRSTVELNQENNEKALNTSKGTE